ncbi:MAG: sigma-70 family RNA polymerase sigma factor [Acidobacteria bacterium]|nr:sigma-70 family RNA polymerase sigma factor [Acidobacteriota bacterium]
MQDGAEPRQLDSISDFYADLKEIAGHLLRSERANHTLQRTALAHETFLRLFGKRRLKDIDLEALLPLAAHQMRQVLVDYGRRRRAEKRGGGLVQVPLFESDHSIVRDEDSFLALNEALEELGRLDPRALAVVELKFFRGCTNQEAADELGVSDGTIEAVWLHARLWLYRALNAPPRKSPDGRVDDQRNRSIKVIPESPGTT